MRPNTAARVAAIILAIAGLAAVVAAGLVATRSNTVRRAGVKYDCGSVVASKDPRNKVSRRATIPRRFNTAYKLCQQQNSDLTHKAITFLVVGTIPLLFVLALPAISRSSRRARSRRRTRL